MPGESVPREISEMEHNNVRDINIDSLGDRVCYFSLSGDLALKAFYDIRCSSFNKETARKKLKNELKQRLYFAMLMFDKVVMHCSDPLRNDVVLEVLEENIEWIENGNISFIFSKKINDIRTDYKKYIDKKINEYSEGYCSEKEAESLQQGHITNKYYDRVIKILSATKYLIRKSSDENCSFARLVINDLKPQYQTENVIVDSRTDLSQILSLNLTLSQLLHMRCLKCMGNGEKENGQWVFPPFIVADVIEGVQACLEQGNKIARSAIVDSLEEEIKKKVKRLQPLQKTVLKAITLRMDILYCKMNSGRQLILEFHPLYENRSNYQIDCFSEYLKIIAESINPIELTSNKVGRILKDDLLPNFRYMYLSCMADAREYIKLTLLNQSGMEQYPQVLLGVFE